MSTVGLDYVSLNELTNFSKFAVVLFYCYCEGVKGLMLAVVISA